MPAGLVGALGGRYPDSVVLFDDDFSAGPAFHRWEPLVDSDVPRGLLSWDAGGLVMTTEDQPDGVSTSYPQGQATALKRLTNWAGPAKYAFEVWWSWTATYGEDRLRAVEFVFDVSSNATSNNRRYYAYRCLIYDETASALSYKWYLRTGPDATPTYEELPDLGSVQDTDYPRLPFNEGKRNWIYSKFIVDLEDECYDGMQVNDYGFGSLAATPNQTHRAKQGSVSSLATFRGGLNMLVQARNRNGQKASAAVYVHRARGTVVR